jgi:hypothetical protein
MLTCRQGNLGRPDGLNHPEGGEPCMLEAVLLFASIVLALFVVALAYLTSMS